MYSLRYIIPKSETIVSPGYIIKAPLGIYDHHITSSSGRSHGVASKPWVQDSIAKLTEYNTPLVALMNREF